MTDKQVFDKLCQIDRDINQMLYELGDLAEKADWRQRIILQSARLQIFRMGRAINSEIDFLCENTTEQL